MLGLRTFYEVLANQVVASSALVTVGLLSPIAAGQKQKIRCWIPITVGATGGVRSQVVVPAGGVLLRVSTKLYNTVAPSLTAAISNTGAVFNNALANAGTHWLEIEADIVNGSTAGNVDVQIGQDTTDALTLTVLRGGSMEVVKY